MIKFESLNERWGNSIRVQWIHSEEGEDTIYLETDEDNIIMLQKLDTANYLEYIKKEYFNAPTFTSEKDLLKYIDSFMA